MVVKVYAQIRAACPQRVLHCLLEKNIEFEVIHIDLDSFEQKKPEFLQRQPFGLVPAIEDGDLKLFESRAIMRYYADKYTSQGPNLMGQTLEQRAIIDQWTEVESQYFSSLVVPIVINIVVKPKFGQKIDEALVEELKGKLDEVLDVYEDRLGKCRYVAGDEFTMADLTLMPTMRYLMNETGLSRMVTARMNLYRWWQDVSARPAWKKLMQMAGY